ncbi:hypothetical protein SB18R_13025 [Pseudomonas oryzihabitans]|nr:hypothetical protein NS201_18555 [Pseudomonas psychrotolerans]KTT37050.1 hypothetical protein SB9_03455 [Pseudomonas psychrotolerans]KTT75656.1 hypothetical protein SB18R_13025 [Pseudomonas psychrotolerans]
MAVVVEAGFGVVVLALEAQGLGDLLDVQAGQVAVGAIAGGPGEGAAGVGEFLGSAEVVEVVVVGRYRLGAFADQ